MYPMNFHSLAVLHCLGTFILEQPVTSAKSKPEKQVARLSGLLFDAVKYLLFDKPWRDPETGTAARFADIAHTLLEKGADPNIQFDFSGKKKSSWELALLFASRIAPYRTLLKEQFRTHTGVGYPYAKLLISLVKYGADPNARGPWPEDQVEGRDFQSDWAGKLEKYQYSALKALEYVFWQSAAVLDDEPDFDWMPKSAGVRKETNDSYLKEMAVFKDYLISIIETKGGVRRAWKDGRLIEGPLEDDPSRLTLPKPYNMSRKARSADELTTTKRKGLKLISQKFAGWIN
jgi:hypothetical protein